MEEKILIKSFSSEKTKRFFLRVIIALLIISAISLFVAINVDKQEWAEDYIYGSRYSSCYFCREVGSHDAVLSHILKSHSDEYTLLGVGGSNLIWFILHWSFILFAGIFYLIYFLISRCNITVSETNIIGRTFWGKKVVLPIHMVSAYSINKIFSVVAITTASGFVKFPCIGNYEKIADVLQQLLNERQKRTETQENLISKQNNSKNLDDLIRLKSLLDYDIITKEEFEKKKKEILG